MKKIILILILILVSNCVFSQVKQRSVSTSFYTGIGYKFVFLTNSKARDSYSFFQLSSGDFLKEIDGYFGVVINETYGIEIAPSYLFTNSIDSKGFYFTDPNGTRFYEPQYGRLFAVPLNLKFKFYPFGKQVNTSLNKLYLGVGGGAVYFDEEITSQIFQNEDRLIYYGAKTAQGDFWTSDFEFMVGYGSFAKIGYGFELSYRFIPMKQTNKKPIVTDIVQSFNSINFSANIIYTF